MIFNEISSFRCSILKFHDFEISEAQLESTISRAGDVQSKRKWHRSKAESQGFRSVPFSSKLDVTSSRYGRFEFGHGI